MVEADQTSDTLNNMLTAGNFKSVTVSSVLNKNQKEYGKKHLYDGKDETCWNSDQGSSQHITVNFEDSQMKTLSKIALTSQGGFCPKEMVLFMDSEEV